MKKLKSVLNGFMGCGIPSLPKKFTWKRGEVRITAMKPHENLILAAGKVPSMTNDICLKRRRQS